MQVLLVVSVALLAASWVGPSRASPVQPHGRLLGSSPPLVEPSAPEGAPIASGGKGSGGGQEVVEDVDFEDDEGGESVYLVGLGGASVDSVRHLHQKDGEILVPCFGMWWPVGGGTVTYDYIGDYYGDYRKKRRRSRKQKKAAKMQKKKS